jgi:hypothetical protein
MDTTLRVHLVAAPVFAFLVAAIHAVLAPGFDPVTRAIAMTLIILGLDAFVVAPSAATRCFAASSARGCHSLRSSRAPGLGVSQRPLRAISALHRE